ncbi:MAG: zf-HC2 domain-containing protein [Caulobacteraceae bacterium]|nr:zf-HC2 domain-containing protein [Caulobacteraceae bacterium]
MTGRIIPLHGNRHAEAHGLLPWYVTGRLGAAERARVEVHLNGCPECQADLKVERALRATIADLRMDVEQDWAKLRGRLERESPARARAGGWRAWLGATVPRWTGAMRPGGAWGATWALVPSLGLLLLLAGVLTTPARPARYRLLAAAPPPVTGNMVVIFRPQTSEADLRRILGAHHARIVDGPTSADAWLVQAPAGQRAAILARLRGEREIALAEPVDSGGSR